MHQQGFAPAGEDRQVSAPCDVSYAIISPPKNIDHSTFGALQRISVRYKASHAPGSQFTSQHRAPRVASGSDSHKQCQTAISKSGTCRV